MLSPVPNSCGEFRPISSNSQELIGSQRHTNASPNPGEESKEGHLRTDIEISDLRASLNGKVIGSDDSRLRRRAPSVLHRLRPPARGHRPRGRRIGRGARRDSGAADGRRARHPKRRPQPGGARHVRGRHHARPLPDERSRNRRRRPSSMGADRRQGRRLHQGDRRTRSRDRARRHRERRSRGDHARRRHRLPRPQARAHHRRRARR